MLDRKYRRDVWCSLIKEKIDQGETVSIEITTDSMMPLIKPCDKVTVKSCSAGSVNSGDIVLFEIDSQLYSHRLLYKKNINNELFLITKGDKAYTFDKPFSEKWLLGKVINIKKGSKAINLEKWQWVFINRFLLVFSCLKAYSLPIVRYLKYVFHKK